jgi:hypothetical protein
MDNTCPKCGASTIESKEGYLYCSGLHFDPYDACGWSSKKKVHIYDPSSCNHKPESCGFFDGGMCDIDSKTCKKDK